MLDIFGLKCKHSLDGCEIDISMRRLCYKSSRYHLFSSFWIEYDYSNFTARYFREMLELGEDVATCPSCSLIIRVIYDPDMFISLETLTISDSKPIMEPA